GWVYRAAVGAGHNFYAGFLDEYGLHSGILMVLALMVVSSVLSMALRQLRHLAEKPSDLLRLPFFILFSTAFLMPIRIIGFFRMGHASGWATRSGAYAGGASIDALVDRLAESGRPIVRGAEASDEELLAGLGFDTEPHTQGAVATSP